MSSPHLPSPSASIPPSSLAAARSSSQLQLVPATSSSSLSQQAAAVPGSTSSSASSFPPPPTPSSLSSDWSPLTGSTLSPPEAKDDSPTIDPADSLTRSQFITHDMVEQIRATQRAEQRGPQRRERGAAEPQRHAQAAASSSSSSALPSAAAGAPAVPAGSIAASASSPATTPPADPAAAAVSAAASSAVADSGGWQRALHHVITSQQLEAQPDEKKKEASSGDGEQQLQPSEAKDDAADSVADDSSSVSVVSPCDGLSCPSSLLWSTVCSRLSSVGSFMSAHPAVPLSLLSLSLLSLGFFLGRRYQHRQQQAGLMAPLHRLQRLHTALEQAARGAGAAGGAVISSGVGWVRGVCGAADRDIPGVIVTVKFL